MILLCIALLGWPTLRTEFGPPRVRAAGWEPKLVAECCGSMQPHLRGGELIYVSPPMPGERLVGHIISKGDALHMVTAENSRAVRTAGTANRKSDGWTPRERIEYVVRYVVRTGYWVLYQLQFTNGICRQVGLARSGYTPFETKGFRRNLIATGRPNSG
jgi:hypothetical protein